MPIQKESITINFSQGLDTFEDSNQLPIGKFVSLQNSVFIKSNTGLISALKKANGFAQLVNPVSSVSFVTTFSNSLIGLGQGAAQGYSSTANEWINQGYFQPVSITANALVRNSSNQSNQDATISQSGIMITAFASSQSGVQYQYAIADSVSGQNLVQPTSLPLNGGSQIIGQPQTYSLGSSFFVAYATTATNATQLVVTQLQNYAPFTVQTSKNVDSSIFFHKNSIPLSVVIPVTTAVPPRPIFDGAVSGNNVYISWISGTASGHLNCSKITSAFVVSTVSLVSSTSNAACISIAVDSNQIYTTTGSAFALNYAATDLSFSQVFTKSAVVSSSSYYKNNPTWDQYVPGITNISSYANGYLWSLYEVRSFFATVPGSCPPSTTNLVARQITSAGVIGSETVINYQMGIGSKPALVNGDIYFVGTYGSPTNLQNTCFLLGSAGMAISKFAYEGGGGYCFYGQPSMGVIGSSAYVSYLIQDQVVSINAATTGSSGSVAANSQNIYAQTGINSCRFDFLTSGISGKDTGNALSIPSGALFNYSGSQLVENNFHLYPEPLGWTTEFQGSALVGSGEFTTSQSYQYSIVYQWTDEQANIHKSAPSIPMTINSYGSVSAQEPYFNLLPLTQKGNYTASLFRWSPIQQTFYKAGAASFTLPFAQNQTTGSISAGLNVRYRVLGSILQFIDFSQDSQIIGNEILYTNGNILEDIGLPACQSSAVWDARFWTILSETGLISYSKPIIPGTPVEMAQEQTLFVPSSQTSQGQSGPPTCVFPLNDKLIIFKKNGMFFINGTGPDVTGANSAYSEPIQIPSGVGCSNQASIVLTPLGAMFQSDNGIWLLGQDLSMKYVGKDVESYNSQTVVSATAVPGTSEVRFTLNSGVVLVYDYLADQWTTRQTGLTPISGTIYNKLHTFVNSASTIYQETVGTYLDGSTATVMSFQTGWVNLVNLQGYVRAYSAFLLGNYSSGHTYTLGIAYDYNPTIVQTATITPTNTIGSGSQVVQWQFNFKQTQCQSFQLTFTEIASGTAGAGLTLSGINLLYGKKKTYPRNIRPKNRIG